jgi:peroxiredoxin
MQICENNVKFTAPKAAFIIGTPLLTYILINIILTNNTFAFKELPMKKSIIFLCIMTMTIISVNAAPSDIPSEVSSAFEKAGLPLLDKKQPIKDFNFTLLDNSSVRLSELKGKVVFLNFWATWCPPCKAEMPSMEKLYQRLKSRGLEMLAVNLRENKNTLDKFITENNLTFPVALDANGKIGSAYNIRYIPTTYIISRDSRIIAVFTGGKEWDTPELITAFEKLLALE